MAAPFFWGNQIMKLERAYSVLNIKSVDEDKRELRGVATTPSTDRMGDVVEPKGADYTLPIPLLWQHDSSQPIGHVTAAKVSKDGIEITAKMVEIKEPGRLKDRLDEAWQSIKSGLVRGLSIGFQAKETARIEDSFGYRFIKWNWLELSAVTIPANAEASITAIKSISDTQLRAASGLTQKSVVTLDKSAGASAKQIKTKPEEGIVNMDMSEKIKSWETKLFAVSEQMDAIMKKAADEDRTLDDDESTQYDDLKDEKAKVEGHLQRLRDHEASVAAKAKPVSEVKSPTEGSRARDPYITVKDNLPKGVEFARYVKCLAAARGNRFEALEIAKSKYPDHPRLHTVLKAAVNAGTTTDAAWAGPLVEYNTLVSEFIEFLRPQTIIGRLPALRAVPFNIRMQMQTSGGEGYWVGQGAPKPLTSFNFDDVTLGFAKVANIAVLTDELVRFSNPSADVIVRQSLADALRARLDIDFVDPAKALVSNVSPASITNGVTGLTSSGTGIDGVYGDVQALMNAFLAANLVPNAWIMSSINALALSMMRNALGQREFPDISVSGGSFMGLPVVTSEYLTQVGDTSGSPLILLNTNEIYLADDGQVVIDASREASLQMLDNPTNNSSTATATTMVSMFQTNSIALKAERFINWQRRRDEAVQYVEHASYTNLSVT